MILDLFLLSNVSFMAVDIWIAHSYNNFHHTGEWIPFWYSIIGTILLTLTGLLTKFNPLATLHKVSGYTIGLTGVIIGFVGLYFHLESQFFQEWTLSSLIYTAPFMAPLAFSGQGFLLMLNRSKLDGNDWNRWVLFLAGWGALGNLGLALADHAQNGFWHATEWIPVIFGAFAVSSLILATWYEKMNLAFLRYLVIVMLLQIGVGVLGFVLHVYANLGPDLGFVYEKFVYGAPAFAPLLFADVAALALLGLLGIKTES